MELFVAGMALGFLGAFILFWNRTRRLEDEIMYLDDLLRDMSRLVRRQNAILKKLKRGSRSPSEDVACKSRDLFKQF